MTTKPALSHETVAASVDHASDPRSQPFSLLPSPVSAVGAVDVATHQDSVGQADAIDARALSIERLIELEDDIEKLSQAVADRFEELSLIHELTERLNLDEDSSSICNALLDQLSTCIGAATLVIELDGDQEAGSQGALYQAGRELSQPRLDELITAATDNGDGSDSVASGIVVCNRLPVGDCGTVHVLIIPIEHQRKRLGRMVAVRIEDDPQSTADNEFGTIEADLMKSTSMMLGVHLVNQRQYRELQEMFEGMVQSLASALDAKDTYTCGHSSRVAELAVELARRLQLEEDHLGTIRMAGILHDIGKIGVEDSVLRKPGKLTKEEFEQIKEHPVLGFEILQGIRPFGKILPAVRHHHESWDGTGYPDGLAGESIPRDAQILAVADAFDAMTSDRPYRPGMSLDKVTMILREGRGTQWAADVVDTLLDAPEVMEQYARKEPAERC